MLNFPLLISKCLILMLILPEFLLEYRQDVVSPPAVCHGTAESVLPNDAHLYRFRSSRGNPLESVAEPVTFSLGRSLGLTFLSPGTNISVEAPLRVGLDGETIFSSPKATLILETPPVRRRGQWEEPGSSLDQRGEQAETSLLGSESPSIPLNVLHRRRATAMHFLPLGGAGPSLRGGDRVEAFGTKRTAILTSKKNLRLRRSSRTQKGFVDSGGRGVGIPRGRELRISRGLWRARRRWLLRGRAICGQ